jgi:aspartate-semialdehyde dehydrogenase
VVVLKPLHDAFTIKRVVVSTYQAVSGTGQKAINELETQVRQMFNGIEPEAKVYPHQIAFNCLPQIDVFSEGDYTFEEIKMIKETAKIMGDDSIKVTATTVRVPVFYGHSESVNLEFDKPATAAQARAILAKAPGIQVYDNPSQKMYPMPLMVAGEDEVFVGRIREDDTVDSGLNLWIVSDNIRKGAALNAVQIAELLMKKGKLKV